MIRPPARAGSVRREHDLEVVTAGLRIRQEGGEGSPAHDMSTALGALAVADGDDIFEIGCDFNAANHSLRCCGWPCARQLETGRSFVTPAVLRIA